MGKKIAFNRYQKYNRKSVTKIYVSILYPFQEVNIKGMQPLILALLTSYLTCVTRRVGLRSSSPIASRETWTPFRIFYRHLKVYLLLCSAWQRIPAVKSLSHTNPKSFFQACQVNRKSQHRFATNSQYRLNTRSQPSPVVLGRSVMFGNVLLCHTTSA